MIDKIGDDKCFIGAYAYHVAVRNKINELVDAVNKLESHRHEYYRSTGVNVNMATSEPICDLQNAKCKDQPITDKDIEHTYNDIYVKEIKKVMQEVYYLATEMGDNQTARDFVIASKLKPYIEEK